jgi:hypothetical protein
MVDFKSAVYYPVAAFWNGANPYDRASYLALYPTPEGFAPYLPGTFLVYLPFGLMPVGMSAFIYFFLTVALTVLLAFTALKFNRIEVSNTAVVWIAALVLLSRPGQWNLLLGQVAVQTVLATYVALHYARRAPLLSGLGLAACMLKLSFGLPLAVLMLARRNMKAVLLGTGITAIINLPLISVLVQRAGGVRSFWEQLINTQQVWQRFPDTDPASSLIRIDVTALISRFWGHSLNSIAQLLVAFVVLGITILAVRRKHNGEAISDSLVCLAILLSVHHQGYDLVLLVLPFVALVRRPASEFSSLCHRRFLVGLYAMLAVNYVSTASVVSSFRPNRGIWLVLASINGVLLLAIFLMYLTLAHPWERFGRAANVT